MIEKKPSPLAQENETGEHEDKTEQREFGGYKAEGLLEPTRYGDWEVKGRCSDF